MKSHSNQMKIKYKVKEVAPKIYAVIIEDNYDRAMTFLRGQEYYESPNLKFRGKSFEIWDYMKWYSLNNKKGFTYALDWTGFNIPLIKLIKCYDEGDFVFTPYDEVMNEIVWDLYEKDFDSTKYVIGTKNITDEVFKHEVCHGLWYTNKEYKKIAKGLVAQISAKHYKIYKANLLSMGYTNKVVDDEIQAYLTTFWNYLDFCKGVETKHGYYYHNMFSQQLRPYLKIK